MKVKNVIFDLGGVLVDWNPRYLFRKIFSSEEKMENFLKNVCHQDWNEKQDAGRSFEEGIAELLAQHPHFKDEILAYDSRWEEMLAGDIPGTVLLLEKIKRQDKHRVLALSNWSADKFPVAERRFSFLKLFEHIVVSGRVKMKKPDEDIFLHLCQVCEIKPAESVFIDDVPANLETAKKLGFQTLHFVSPEKLKKDLHEMQILVEP